MTLITGPSISTPATVAVAPQSQPLPPRAPVPAPDAWPGSSKDKIQRKIQAINTWRTEVASHDDVITCACSNGFFSPGDGWIATAVAKGTEIPRSRPLSCEVCRRPTSSSAADDSSNANGCAKSKGSSSKTGRSSGGGLGSVRKVLRRLGSGHKSAKNSTPPTATADSQPSVTDGTRMYATQQEMANAAGEDSDDEGSSEAGGLMSKEARLRRAQKLLAKHNNSSNHHHRGQSGGGKGGADAQHGQGPGR